MNDVNAILLLSCPDSKGLVAKISNFIFTHDGNIVHVRVKNKILVYGSKTIVFE